MAVPRREVEEVGVDPVLLGRYILLDPIAQGRTGTVHRACLRSEGEPDELLAIKRIAPELSRDRPTAERIMELFGRAAQLDHPAHCAILDFEQTPDGTLYVATELVAGKDLGHIAAQLDEIGRAMPPQLVAYVGTQIAEALDAAHRMTRGGQPAPLHHGELSPADILIGYDGRVRLTGLGTVELGLAEPRRAYRAPELARGGACSARSDVFSLAACLYEVLAGRPAFADDPRGSHGRRRPESHITKVIPRPLEQILSRALAEQPEARWRSTAELGRALQRWSAEQSGRSDASALAVFMISIFDAAIEDEDKRLRAWLARAARLSPHASDVPSASAPSAKAASASEPSASAASASAPSEPASLPARNSYARLVRASARPAPSTQLQDWNEPAEHTPARGLLMSKLAADMIDKSGKAEPDAARRDLPPHPAAGLAFADLLSDESWEDDKPAVGWIAESEERAHSIPPKAPAASAQVVPAAAPAGVPAKLPRTPGRSAAPASARPPAAHPTSARPPAVHPTSARPPAAAHPSSARPPAAPPSFAVIAADPFAPPRRRARWLAPALAVAGLGLVLVAVVALRSAGGQHSTLHVQTRPPGAEVFLRGERLGTAPLSRNDLASGSATLELHAPGFDTAIRTIQLEPGKALSLDVDMIRGADRAVAAPSSAAAREADLQAQLAAARLAEPGAGLEADGADDNQAGSEDRRPRRSGAGARNSASDSVTAEIAPAAVAPAASSDQAVLELKPVAPEPAAPAAAAAAPVQIPAPAPAAPAAQERHGPTRAPVVVRQETPRFPARARRMGVAEGVVSIEFTIDAGGTVKDASVVKADPPGLFDEAALRAIEKWRYRPKLEDGQPVASRQRFTFRFQD